MTTTYEVGFGLIKATRDYLRQMQFAGWNFDWLEGSGRISRPFTIRAEPDVIVAIDRGLRRRFPVDS